MAGAYSLFKAAERLEQLASELYLALAERFAGDAEASELFRRLADEEVQHAARIQLLAAEYRNDPRLFSAAAALRGKGPDADAFGRETAAAVGEVRGGGWGATLDDVVRRAGELEERCAGVHAQFLALGAGASVVGFFEELARQDREHRRLLAALAERRTA